MRPLGSTKTDIPLLLAIGALGFTSLITQTIVLREFLSVFSGNELVIGIVLASWMLLTGGGAFLGRAVGKVRHRMQVILGLMLPAALLPAATVFLLYFLKSAVFPAGTMVGLAESVYGSLLLLFPYCVTSGCLFTLFAQWVSENSGQRMIARVYSLEMLGSLLGGLVFNVALVFFLTTFQSLILLTLVNLGVCLSLSLKYRFVVLTSALAALIVVVGVFAVTTNLDAICRGFLFKGQDLVYLRDTPYGNLTVTRQGEQLNFYENSILLFSTQDPTSNEESVHYAMLQHPHPRRVLLISGGISGALPEIMKYGVDRIDYVEINPWLIDLGRRFTPGFESGPVRVFNEDARKFVRKTSESYDVVLVNVPDPTTAQINRYYTVEFLQQLKQKLNDGAVVSFGLLPSADYQGEQARQISSIFYHTLQTTFRNVLIVPGLKNYYVASDRPLRIDIAALTSSRGLNNLYVNPYYLDDADLRQRSEEMTRNILPHTALNRDFVPVAYYRQVQYWLSYFHFNPWWLGGIAAAVLVFLAMHANTISVGLFTGGFAASSLEMLLLISFQVLYGYVYLATGMIITIFMAGLAAGAWYGQRRVKNAAMAHFIGIQGAVALFSLCLPLILMLVKDHAIGDVFIHALFALLTFTIALFIGFEFWVASRLREGTVSAVASELYSVDLVGSALGAFLVSTVFLPLLGVAKTGAVIAALCFMGAMVAVFNRKQYTKALSSEVTYV